MNYVAIVVAAIAAFLVGWLWYGPLFGKQWMSLMGITKKEMEKGKKEMQEQMPVMILVGFLATLAMAFVLAFFVSLAQSPNALWGMCAGAIAWFGFVMTVLLNSFLYEKRPISLWMLNAAHYLVALVLMGAIIGGWR